MRAKHGVSADEGVPMDCAFTGHAVPDEEVVDASVVSAIAAGASTGAAAVGLAADPADEDAGAAVDHVPAPGAASSSGLEPAAAAVPPPAPSPDMLRRGAVTWCDYGGYVLNDGMAVMRVQRGKPA